ncbi:20355_t:CDS:1, partial [Dentiscutata erythropus]
YHYHQYPFLNTLAMPISYNTMSSVVIESAEVIENIEATENAEVIENIEATENAEDMQDSEELYNQLISTTKKTLEILEDQQSKKNFK